MTCSKKIFAVLTATCTYLITSPSHGCTTFSYASGKQSFMAKSYDWSMEQGFLHINKRHVAKSALKILPTDQPLSWTSRYGSLTFNQYGRELPNAGINEAGLVVEVMELKQSTYPQNENKSSLNESQWVQYLLDTAGSVVDAKSIASQVRIAKILVPLHYLACDATGACAAFEYVNGRLTITDLHKKDSKVLTNDTYTQLIQYRKKFLGFGGTKPLPTGSTTSQDRFVLASHHVKTAPQSIEAADAFGFAGLSKVFSPNTRWQIVYNLDQKSVSFHTTSVPQTKSINLEAFDFSCKTPVKTFDMQSPLSGDVTQKFSDYSEQQNTALVDQSLGTSVPPPVVAMARKLPGTTSCQE